jgi:putative FmdB family regulatory protein
MPTYVYRCGRCGERFEHDEPMSEHLAVKLKCPKCESDEVASTPAPFIAKTSRKS